MVVIKTMVGEMEIGETNWGDEDKYAETCRSKPPDQSNIRSVCQLTLSASQPYARGQARLLKRVFDYHRVLILLQIVLSPAFCCTCVTFLGTVWW